MDDAEPLTPAQTAALAAFAEAAAEAGRPPSVRELARRLRCSAVQAAYHHLCALRQKGYLARHAGARGFRLTEAGRLAAAAILRDRSPYAPIVGRVAAGAPIFAAENFDGVLEIDRATLGVRGAVFALRVTGDSMTGDGILDGDYVLVREQPKVDPGEIGIVVIDGEATVKRIYPRRDGLELRPSNPRYAPIRVPADRLEAGEAIVAGRVVGVWRPRVARPPPTAEAPPSPGPRGGPGRTRRRPAGPRRRRRACRRPWRGLRARRGRPA